MEIYHKDGTFPRYCEAVRKSLDDNRFNEFAQLTSDEERFRFVNGLRKIVDELQLKREYNGKGMEQATALKTLGNKAFQAERWNDALVFYNKCYVSTPKENGKQAVSGPDGKENSGPVHLTSLGATGSEAIFGSKCVLCCRSLSLKVT